MSDEWDWTLPEVIAHPQEAFDYIRELQKRVQRERETTELLQRTINMLCKQEPRIQQEWR